MYSMTENLIVTIFMRFGARLRFKAKVVFNKKTGTRFDIKQLEKETH